MEHEIKNELTGDELSATHELYIKYNQEWRFLNAAYEGVRALVEWGAIEQHERESEVNYNRRIDEAYGFSYSRSIVDILNSYLFKKEYPRTIPETLAGDPAWLSFMDDCNLEKMEFDEFFIEQQRQASIQGHIGLLVDKPRVNSENVAQEKEKNIYPYVVAYKPTYILDWEYERDETGRRELVYLKVLDDDDYYRVWTKEEWQVWQLIEEEGVDVAKSRVPANTKQKVGMAARLVDSGMNPLGEIPFVWLFNERSTIDKEIGKSDINDVARIDCSIIRNMSQIEEIINYAAFPMMRKPMQEGTGSADQDDEVGVTAVLEFDPEHPESKPDWLNSEVAGPIDATLKVVAKKIEEIYRSSNVGGMAATEIQTSPKSGTALKSEFQLLNSKLVKKGKNVVRAKREVVDFWLKWMQIYESMKEEVEFAYIKTFEVEDLMTDLENILTGKAIVTDSPSFLKEVQKIAARLLVPAGEDELLALIDEEIDSVEYTMNPMFGGEEGTQPNFEQGTTGPGTTETTTTEGEEEDEGFLEEE